MFHSLSCLVLRHVEHWARELKIGNVFLCNVCRRYFYLCHVFYVFNAFILLF